MTIYRIDGNNVFSDPIIGLSYHSTKKLAEEYLENKGFYLEIRKWDHIVEHFPNKQNYIWYNKKLSDDGYPYDNTLYRIITEIDVNVSIPDIRNKLSPFKNLIAMIEGCKIKHSDERINRMIKQEIENCKKSI